MTVKRLVSLLAVFSIFGGCHGVCVPYQKSCNVVTQIDCCGSPLVACLPDSRNGTSCLFFMDLANLSPTITSLVPFGPALADVESTANNMLRMAFNPSTDPLANPIVNPIANPILDPAANPLLDPAANPILNPVDNPLFNPILRGGK